MCEALGVGDTNMTQFHSWTADVALFAARVDPRWGPDAKATLDRSNDSWLALEDMFRRLIVEKRARPADDMLSALVRHFDDGTISEDELIGLSVFFLAAGHGTTRDLLTNGLYLLLAHPQEAKKLANGPGLIGAAVEEVLRYESPIPMVSQLAVESFDLGGTMIGKGDAVVLQLSGANRDPDRFPDAAAFDTARQDNRHLAFGWGAHFCLGAPLARMQAAVVFQAMAPLLPELELESTEPTWKTGDLTERTLTELPVSWVSATVDQLGNEDRA
jgi:cytochrome P450